MGNWSPSIPKAGLPFSFCRTTGRSRFRFYAFDLLNGARCWFEIWGSIDGRLSHCQIRVTTPRFSHQPQGCLRTQIAQENIPAEIDLGLVALVLGMDVGRRMIIVIHSNDDSEKTRDFRHGILLDVGPFSAK